MKQKEFSSETMKWMDEFISEHNRGPIAYWEYIQFVSDKMVDMGAI